MNNKKEIEYVLGQKIDNLNLKQIYRILDKEKIKYRITKHNIRNIMYIIRPKFKNIKIINKIKDEYLKNSEMLIKVLNSQPKNINCKKLEETIYIDYNGDCWGCCPGWIKTQFGNIENKKMYNSYRAKIIKLSSINKTYCFCDLAKCKHVETKDNQIENKLLDKNYPEEITIAHDKTCNLKCSSCRKKYYKNKHIRKTQKITNDITTSPWIKKSAIILAGQGEVFFSKEYKKILEKIENDTLKILTNGIFLNKKNWSTINKYKNLYISISIDAATKETYFKLRSGNFDTIIKNLEMIKNERKENLKELQLNFVVQKDNYKEMIKFIELGKKMKVDKIQFTKLNNWGTFDNKEYQEKSLIMDDYLKKELYDVLKQDIFKDEIVDIVSFKKYMDKSKIKYE